MGDFKNSITAAEINLADDAPWKKIQKNTFTRWCNEHLKTVDLQIKDLKFDLSDGLVLISLLEVLSHKRMFRKYHTRPTFRQLKLDNVSVALEFLDLEKVKLVSIDSKAIVDGNMKLILGLVWTLIQHYSISTPVWEDEVNDSVTKLTPEMRLLGWIRNKVPELPITNFNQDWQDGKALGALVDGLAPGLCPDWESWDTVHRVSNTKEAMQQAHDWLGIPQLIAPEEILDPSVDEQSVMTYLSLFPKARLKPGAPLKAKKVPKPKACRVTGRGLQSRGVRVGQLVEFKVDTRKAGPGNLEVHMSDPSGNKVFVMQKDVLEGVYTFEYKPSAEGVHTVDITWVGQHIPKSPFKIHVGPEAGPQKIRAWGPGLEGGVVGSSADFLVESINADSGLLAFAIEGPSPAKIECNDQNDGSCLVRFWPTEAGEYAVHVMCDDEEIQDSPFMASIKPKRKHFYPDKVKVHGPGVSQTGCIVNNQTEFTVDTRHAGEGELKVYAQRADGECVNLSVSSEESGIFVCSYIPSSLSKHTITVAWGGLMVPGSPFIVIPCRIKIKPCSPVWFKPDGSEMYYSDEDVDLDQEPPENIWPGGHGGLVMNISNPSNLPADATKVEAHGPGLKEGLLGEQAEFIIDTRGAGSGRLDIRVDGPCQVTLQSLDNQDGTCTVFYLPTEPGNYKIKVLFDNSHIPGSPFEAVIQRPLDPSKVLVTGPGLIQGNVGEPSIVNIDCTMAGCGDLLVQAISDSGSVAQTEVKKNKDGTYTVVYVPLTAGIYMLLLKYGGKVVPDFPAKVMVNPKIYKSRVKVPRKGRRMGGERDDDLSQVVADGVGLLQGLMGCPNMFSVNTRGASADDLGITVEGPSECEVTCKDNGEGLYHVEYIPSVPGQYEITITCDGNSIPGSPFIASVKDVAIIADSEISTACRQSEICAQIPDAAAVIFLQGMTELTEVTDNGDGIYTVSYPASIEADSCMEPQSPDECSSPISCEKLPNCDGVRELALAPAVNMAENIGPDVKDGICARTSPTFTIGCSRSGAAPETVAEVKLDGTIKHLELTNRVGKPDGEKVMPTTDSARGNEGVFNKEELLSPALEERVCDKAPPLTNSCSVNSVTPDTVANGTIKNDGAGTSKIAFSPNMERCHTGMVKYTSEETFENLFEFQQGLSGDNTEPKIYSQVPQSFTISCSEAGMPPESVVIITPNGITELMEIKDNTDGTYTVNYSPSAEGSHSLMVKYPGDDLYSNLMRFHVQPTTHSVWKDENIINKSEVSSRRLEEDICAKIPQTFTTDCSTIRGTSETVTMVSSSGTTHLAEVVNNEKEICALNHTPSTEESQYSALRSPNEEPFFSISQKFSSQDSSCGNSLENKVVDRDSIAFGPINHAGFISCDIAIPSDLCEGGITGEVVTPSGVTAQPAISDNGDGTISLKFDPSEEGLHHLLIKSSGTDGPDLPLQYYANSLANRSMMAYGCGLMYGIANETATFTICQEDSASGDLDITVEGPSETEVCCFDNEDGTCTVTYLPTKPGDYEIQVRHNDMPIQGSPFQAKIADGNLRRSVVKLGSAVDFTLDISEEDISQLSASVMSPTGIDVPCLLKAQPDSHLGISFIPREAGEHRVSIMKGGGHVKNSPISLSISQAEIGDAGKVKAFGPGLHTGQTYHLSDFMVDTWDAGYGGLTVVIEGPSNVDVHTEELEHGTCKISYCPTEAGTYIISIKFSNDHIPGSPFKAVVIDSGLIQERIEYNQKPAIFHSTGNECSLAFKIPGVDAETLSAHVRAPSGTLAEAKIVASGGDNYAVSFVAEVIGVYDVIVSSLGQPIPGCPFQYTVGPLGEGESGKVQVLGSGLQRTQASVPGDYEVSVLLNKDHVSESPFHVSVSENLTQGQMEQNYDLMSKGYGEPSQPEMEINLTSDGTAEPVFLSNASKIISHGPGLSKGFLGQKNTFYVDCSKAGRNLLFVGMHGPNVPCERVSIIHMGGHQYRINYAVKERGKYILAVKWGDEHIPGSPFHISVL